MITSLTPDQSHPPVKCPELFIRGLLILPILHFFLLAVLPEHASSIHLLRPIGVIGSVVILFYAAFITKYTRRWSWFFQGLTMSASALFNLLRIGGVALTHPNMQLLALAIYIGSLIASGLYLQQRSWWVGNRWRVISSGITVGYASLVLILVCLPFLVPEPITGRITTTSAYVAYDVGILFSFGLQGLRQGIVRSPIRFLLPGLLCLLLGDIIGVVFALNGTTINWHWPLYTFHAIFLALTAYRDALSVTAQDSAPITPLKEWIVWAYLPLCLALLALFATSATNAEGIGPLLLTGLLVVAICNEAIAVHDYQRVTVALHQAQIDSADLAAERERNRIASELHDSLNYHLATISQKLDRAQKHLTVTPSITSTEIYETRGLTRFALADARGTLQAIRRGNIQPLEHAIEELGSNGLAVRVRVAGKQRYLPPEVALAGYRIAQETIANTLKHAPSATSITFTLDYQPHSLVLTSEDDGQPQAMPTGLDHTKMGLTGLSDRIEQLGGTLEFGPGATGFRVHAEIPTENIYASDARFDC